MHYICEIIMPPTDNVEAAVTKAMEDFREGGEDSYKPFWDFWVIGGRFSGHKLEAKYPEDQLSAFYDKLREAQVQVKGVICGKQELAPEFIEFVDKTWAETVPGFGKVCPLFNRYNDQYQNSTRYPDISLLEETPLNSTACRVIIVDHNFKPVFMLEDEFYNGVNFVKTAWDGTVGGAIDMFRQHYSFKNHEDLITDDSLVVTVDYHS